ncbi:MAG: hypothetical protein ACREJO_08925 [Phycisphaerales bacterium]
MTRSALLVASVGLASLAGLSGCVTPNPPAPATSEPKAVDLRTFADRTAQALAMKISGVPQIAQSSQRVVIYLGAIEKQGNTPVGDYEYVRRRLQDQLVNSDVILRLAAMYEQPEINDQQLERLRAPGPGQPPRFDPQIVYVLNGWFGELSQGQGYYLQMKLVHLSDGQIVFSQRYDSQEERPPR